MEMLFVVLGALVVGVIAGGGAMYIYKNVVERAKDDMIDVLQDYLDQLEELLDFEEEDEE